MGSQSRRASSAAAIVLSLSLLAARPGAAQQQNDLQYHTIPPCNVVNTYVAGGAFASNETRTYNVVGTASLAAQGGSASGCNIPGFSNGVAQVQAVQLILSGVNPSTGGYMIVSAADQPLAPIGELALNPGPTQNLSIATVAVAQTPGVGDFKVNYAIASGNVVINVLGYYTKQVQTVTVHPVPGDPAASGTSLANALAGIADAAAAKPYVVHLEPGIYDVGATPVAMKAFVDLEGAGQQATVVRGQGHGSDHDGVIDGASNSELRNLQVQAAGQSGQTYTIGVAFIGTTKSSVRSVTVVSSTTSSSNPLWGIRNLGSSTLIQDTTITLTGGGTTYGIADVGNGAISAPIIKHTVIIVSGASFQTNGIYNGDLSAPAEIRDVEIQVTGGSQALGINNTYSGVGPNSLTFSNSTIAVSGGASANTGIGLSGAGDTLSIDQTRIQVAGASSFAISSSEGFGSSINVDRSEITGGSGSVSSSFSAVNIGASRVGGSVSGGPAKCAASYSGSYVQLSSTCT
jgi:hypothetical protein